METEESRAAVQPGAGDRPVPDLWTIGDGFRIALCVTDAGGHILYANDAFSKEVGFPADQLLKMNESEVTENAVSKMVAATGKVSAIPVLRANSYAMITGIPVFSPEGELAYVGITLETDTAIEETNRSFQQLIEGRRGSISIQQEASDFVLQTLTGRNKKIAEIRDFILQIGPVDATVLITGESGCGKEVVADCLQRMSARSDKPYVKINCAAIPANLLESELFGYEPGSFTGASSRGKIGLFERANSGTILLDEVGDFPLELQPKLLRFLQHGEVYRIGATAPKKLDVRVIAATNSNLRRKMQEGRFREDLFYRLNVIPIRVPPLRERMDDIFMLAKSFLRMYCRKYDKTVILSDELLHVLETYSWPGNIRELQNVMEYLVVSSKDVHGIAPERLRSMLLETEDSGPMAASTLMEKRDDYEKHLIEEALRREPSLRRAARSLGVYPSTLYRKAKKYNIDTTGIEDAPLD